MACQQIASSVNPYYVEVAAIFVDGQDIMMPQTVFAGRCNSTILAWSLLMTASSLGAHCGDEVKVDIG